LITNTVIYDGLFVISNVTAGTFDIVAAWSATATGSYATLAADGSNIYVGFTIQGAGGVGNFDTHQVVVGTDVVVPAKSSNVVALGSSVVIGSNSGLGTKYAVVVGNAAKVEGNGAIAVGSVAFALCENSMSLGTSSLAGGVGAFAAGLGAIAGALHVVAIGPSAWGYGEDGVVVGPVNTANNRFDVLYGSRLTTPINGSGAASGTIDSVSDAGGGSVTIHSSDIPAGLLAGQSVTIAGTTTYDGTFVVSNVTAATFDIVHVWSVTAAGSYTVIAADGYNIYLGINIVDNGRTGNADTNQVAIGTDIVVAGSRVVVIGASAGSSTGASSSGVIGPSANVSHSSSMVFGSGATSTSNNQVVFGLSGGGSPGSQAVHEFVVRGYNGGNLNTLGVIDNPTDSGDPNLAVTGLSVVVIQNTALANKTLKAAPLANLPGGALVAYF
jgi:trimeric autotransporter adhesin